MTIAIRAVRHRANPTSDLLAAQHQEERRALRELRERIAGRIEADLAILDALDGDPDLEADYTTVEHAPGGGVVSLGRSTDDEPGDNGLADLDGGLEQCGHGAFRDTVFA